MFAAIVFAVFFLALAALIITATRGKPFEVFMGISLLAPCIPLAYFASRGFAHRRRSAFQDMPERACGFAAFVFFAVALTASLCGIVALAIGPGIAAVLFALCVESVRDLVIGFP